MRRWLQLGAAALGLAVASTAWADEPQVPDEAGARRSPSSESIVGLEVSGNPPMVRFRRVLPPKAGDAVIVLRRPGRLDAHAFPSYFTAEDLALPPMEKIEGWEIIGVARGNVSQLAVGPSAGNTYAAALLAPSGDAGGAAVVGSVAIFVEPKARSLLQRFKLVRADSKGAAVWWEPQPGVQASAALLRGPKGATLEPFSYPSAPRIGPLSGTPFETVALVPRNARAYTDSRVEPGEYSYVLALLERVKAGPDESEWRVLTLSSSVRAFVPKAPSAPKKVSAGPPENDDGTHLEITWESKPEDADGFFVFRSKSDTKPPMLRPREKTWSGGWKALNDEPIVGVSESADDPKVAGTFKDTVGHGAKYHYAVVSVRLDYDEAKKPFIVDYASSDVTPMASPRADYFNEKRWAVLALTVLMLLGLLYYVPKVRKDPDSIYIRRIPGVDAIEEAVGRSTEMGRPVLYVTGVENIQNIQTIASLLCLGPVAEMTAEYDTELKVANFEALTMVVAEEIVKQGYANAGRADAHRPENVMFISSEQFAFAAGVNGIILRDKPATNIYLGRFFAESLILAETGYVTKSIQIAGTAEVTQLPFFIAACDYTIIGEELYAVSAYLSRDPKLLATLKASDMLKVVVIATVVIGALLATFGVFDIGPGIAQ